MNDAAAIAGAALEARLWDEARARAGEQRSESQHRQRTPTYTGPPTLELSETGGISIRGKIPVLKRQPDGSYR